MGANYRKYENYGNYRKYENYGKDYASRFLLKLYVEVMNPYDPHYNARADRHVQNLSVTFARQVRQFCIKRQSSIAIDRSPLVQLYRAATSVAANIRESQFAESTKDFIHKLKIAEKELAEYHFWIGLLMDETPIADSTDLDVIHDLSLQLQKLLRSIILAKRANS